MLLVTGGAGFIGANFVLSTIDAMGEPIVNLDKLTYAGRLENLETLSGDARHIFIRGDISDRALVRRLLVEHRPRAIVHFAAESHVDRSIEGPAEFIQTNVVGTFSLLEETRIWWLHSRSATRSASVSCMSPPTKSMDRSGLPTRRSRRRIPTRRTVHMPHPKRVLTTWCAPTITPTACRC